VRPGTAALPDSVPPSAVAVRVGPQNRDEIVGRRDEPAHPLVSARGAPARPGNSVRGDTRPRALATAAPSAAEQERRGTDPSMAGINTRRGALAPRAFRSLIHHEETRS